MMENFTYSIIFARLSAIDTATGWLANNTSRATSNKDASRPLVVGSRTLSGSQPDGKWVLGEGAV